MQYTYLGNSGLQVSRLCLGTMGFGTPGKLFDWCAGEETATKIVKECLDNGINFFDTANVYSDGESEIFLGKVLKANARREEVVIATKCGINMQKDPKPNTTGLSRKLIFDEVEKSLKNLGTDYIDLYIMHHPDPYTPAEETMQALDDLIRMGKVRYIGASNMYAWQFAKYQYSAEKHGWHTFVSLQNAHNLLKREDEREVFPMLKDMGVSLTAYKVLDGGRLSRDTTTLRSSSQTVSESVIAMNDKLQKVAEKHHCSKADVVIAWELRQKPIDAVILGTASVGRMTDSCRALEITIDEEDIRILNN